MWSECKLNEDARLRHFLSCLTIVLFWGKWKKTSEFKVSFHSKAQKFLSCVPHLCLADLLSHAFSSVFPLVLPVHCFPCVFVFLFFSWIMGNLGLHHLLGRFLLENSPLSLICAVVSVIGSSNLGPSDTEHLTLRKNIFITTFAEIPECECANLLFSLTTVSPLVVTGWNRDTRC